MQNRLISLLIIVSMVFSLLPLNSIEAATEETHQEYIKRWVDYVNFSETHEDTYLSTTDKKIDNQEKIVTNPVIQIKFNYKLDKKSLIKNKIKLTSNDGESFVIDHKDIWINHDDHTNISDRNEFGGKVLKIDLNSKRNSGKYPLRKNTLYKLTIEQSAVRLNQTNNYNETTNKEIKIHFITGEEEIIPKEYSSISGYSSDRLKTDDITSLAELFTRTQLGKINNTIGRDGKSIYIHMNEDLRWNTDKLTNNSNDNVNGKISLNKEYLKHFKFYVLPKAYETDEVLKQDKEFRYNDQKETQFKTSQKMVELEIESVDILSEGRGKTKIIKVTPKENLKFYNMYYLKLDDKDIITDVYGRMLKENIDKYIWSSNDAPTDAPTWTRDSSGDPYESNNQITAEEIINNTNTPDNQSVSAWRLYGVPKYNEYINDKNREKPIIMYVDSEVIPNPKYHSNKMYPNIYTSSIYREDTFNKISLIEEFADTQKNKHEIKWYKLEYYTDANGNKKTKISLYPKGELDSGKPYQLDIPKDVFVNRSGQSVDKDLKLKFIIEGDKTKNRGIYSLAYVGYAKPVSVYDNIPSLTLDIKGFNFTEDIKQIRFRNETTGKEIILPKKYNSLVNIEFINVDNIKATLSGDALKEFREKYSGGTYKIYIDFESGNPAISLENGNTANKLVIYEKPYVIETKPNKDDWYFDKGDLYKAFTNGKSGNYLTIVFDNINNRLQKNANINLNDFKFYKNGEPDTSLIDQNRPIEYEGFSDGTNTINFDIKTSSTKKEQIETGYTSAKLYLNDDKYEVGDDIKITLFDADLNLNTNGIEETTVTVTIGDEVKEVELSETARDTGRFEGRIEAWASSSTENRDKIQVKYKERQSANGSIEGEVIADAEIKAKVDYRRKAQLYVDKDLYSKDEYVNIIVENSSKNKFSTIKETLDVVVKFEGQDPQTITLTETGENTGVFEKKDKLNHIGQFEVTYSYTEEIGSGNVGKAKIYIPINDSLEDGTIYVAKIPEGIVTYSENEISDVLNRSNDKYEWNFKTIVPSNVDKSFTGSVPEDYDEDYPIVLTGNNFNKQTRVYFRDTSGREYEGKVELPTTDGKVLNVYLPYGRNKLKVGLYDIVVENTKDTKQVIEYGVLSVVPRGEFVPNEEFVQKDRDTSGNNIREGDLKKYIKTSYDTLDLSSRYTDYAEVELDLDEIMGEEVWSRNISYKGYRNDTINRLITKSKWSDITLTNVTLDTNSSNRDIIIRVGRTPANIEDNIKKKITGKILKSNFIEVGGENYTASRLNLSIPFKESNGKNLKLLRYDEATRRVTEIKLDDRNIDNVNKRINIELANETRGVFVVVE